MKPLLLAAAALLAAPAFADDAHWVFKQGQTFTWECHTFFDYSVMPLTTAQHKPPGSTEAPQDSSQPPSIPKTGKPPCY